MEPRKTHQLMNGPSSPDLGLYPPSPKISRLSALCTSLMSFRPTFPPRNQSQGLTMQQLAPYDDDEGSLLFDSYRPIGDTLSSDTSGFLTGNHQPDPSYSRDLWPGPGYDGAGAQFGGLSAFPNPPHLQYLYDNVCPTAVRSTDRVVSVLSNVPHTLLTTATPSTNTVDPGWERYGLGPHIPPACPRIGTTTDSWNSSPLSPLGPQGLTQVSKPWSEVWPSCINLDNVVDNDSMKTCMVPWCSEVLQWPVPTARHMELAHTELRVCADCRVQTPLTSGLESHSLKTGHASFKCPETECQSTFSRYDVLRRHWESSHKPHGKRFPCKYCSKYRGRNGFKRKDHLTQHVRNFHHIGEDDTPTRVRSCPYLGCESSQMANMTPERRFSAKEYREHMTKVHDQSPFPCPVPGCSRTGGKGYFRERELKKHRLKSHETDNATS